MADQAVAMIPGTTVDLDIAVSDQFVDSLATAVQMGLIRELPGGAIIESVHIEGAQVANTLRRRDDENDQESSASSSVHVAVTGLLGCLASAALGMVGL